MVYCPDNWEIHVNGGYYGEEIGEILLEETVSSSLKEKLTNISSKSDVDKIKLLLEYEYGYLLNVLKNTTKLEILSLTKDEIKTPNEFYYKKLSQINSEIYSNYKLPFAVIRQNNLGDYLIVDGYHRLASVLDNRKLDMIFIS